MAEETNFFSGSSQTFLAASFVVALLALALSIYNHNRTTQAVGALLDVHASQPAAQVDTTAFDAQVAELEERLRALEEAEVEAAAAADPE